MIYVDEFPPGWGKWSGGGHMTCSDIDELHAMAARIGLRRAWFQDKSFPHYDLTKSKRALAIAAGAVEVEFAGETPPNTLMRCDDGTYETKGERMARRRD